MRRWIIRTGLLVGLVFLGWMAFRIGNLQIEKNEHDAILSIRESRERPMIGFCVDGMVLERWQRDIEIFKTRALELGYDVEVMNAYEDNHRQIDQINALVEEGAKAIFILPYDMTALAEAVAKAQKAGVLIISYDRLIKEANVDAYVSFDNYAVGQDMGIYMVEAVGEGNYVLINGSPSDYNATMIRDGYMSILEPLIDSGQIHIIKEVWAPNWREDIAYDAIYQLMVSEQKIDGIIAANDLLAEGAISVLSEYDLVETVKVVGQDAEVTACQRIVEDRQLMTVYKPIKELARGAVDMVDSMIRGQDVVFNDSIYDGKYDVPYIKFPVIPVTKENMDDTIIADNFHAREDIYRNE